MTVDLFQGGLLEAPCTLSNQVFQGGHPVFQGGQAPSAPPTVIRPLLMTAV